MKRPLTGNEAVAHMAMLPPLAYIDVMKTSLDKLRTTHRDAWLVQSMQAEWRRLVKLGVPMGLAGFAAGRFAAIAWQAETANLPPAGDRAEHNGAWALADGVAAAGDV
ncbi:MAG: hypothetical protein B7X48_11050 [Acidiphilium sp. 34-60-192]|nr:MAG: hypothetical protein B7X48_11050 [Acidiphilium sp. 34-60-192]